MHHGSGGSSGKQRFAKLQRYGEFEDVSLREEPATAATPGVFDVRNDDSLLAKIDEAVLLLSEKMSDLRKRELG